MWREASLTMSSREKRFIFLDLSVVVFFFSQLVIIDSDQSVLLTGESVSVILKSSCGNAVHMAHTHNTRKEMAAGLPAVSYR